jgi:glycosyltransferase involved in cell wall biosynthesis
MAMYSLSRSYTLLGHKVSILTMCTPKHDISKEDRKWISSFAKLYTVNVDTSIRIFRLILNYFFSRKPYNAVRFIFPDFTRRLRKILQNETFDIIQIEGLYLVPYIFEIRRHSKAIVSFRAHNVEHEIWDRISQTEEQRFRKRYFLSLAKRIARLERNMINLYDIIVPITHRDEERFNHMGNHKPSFVCHAGLDPDQIASTGSSLNQSSLFFIGSLEWKPNQDGLLWFVRHVWPELIKRNPNLKFHIAGRNAPSWLLPLLKQHGIEFYGEIANAQSFMIAHGIMVAPCFSGSGMRVKIIEAMSMGNPVITTAMGAEGLEVSHGEHLLIADSRESFLQETEHLIKNAEYYMKIGSNAQKFIRMHFNPLLQAEGLLEFYKLHLA